MRGTCWICCAGSWGWNHGGWSSGTWAGSPTASLSSTPHGRAFLAFDGPSRAHHATDWRLPDQLAELAEAGFGGQLLLGGDTTVPGTPGMPYLLRRLRPRLERSLGQELLRAVLVENPARAFALATV